MFGDQKDTQDNLKDSKGQSLTPYAPSSQGLAFTVEYPKLNKLVSALYIVTDIMDKDEPIRLKLRTLSVEILSDTHTEFKTSIKDKVQTILSLLDVSLAINLISEMNFNILRKEFTELSNSINKNKQVNHAWLEEFLIQPSPKEEAQDLKINRLPDIKGQIRTRIGVQKGSTLMKALSDKANSLSDRNFNLIKEERRNLIIKSIKDNGGSATITDIKTKATGSLVSYGEKTLQRELVSMVKDGVLKKTGEKRWSRYFLEQ